MAATAPALTPTQVPYPKTWVERTPGPDPHCLRLADMLISETIMVVILTSLGHSQSTSKPMWSGDKERGLPKGIPICAFPKEWRDVLERQSYRQIPTIPTYQSSSAIVDSGSHWCPWKCWDSGELRWENHPSEWNLSLTNRHWCTDWGRFQQGRGRAGPLFRPHVLCGLCLALVPVNTTDSTSTFC